MNQNVDLNAKVTKLYGYVKRARKCYIYTEKGVRLTDMHLQGGRAILGWGEGGARSQLKDSLAQNHSGMLPGRHRNRLNRVLKELFPAFEHFACFFDYQSAELFLEKIGIETFSVIFPLHSGDCENSSAAIIIPPFPFGEITIVAFNSENPIPVECNVPGAILAAVTKAFYDSKSEKFQPTEEALRKFDDKIGRFWTRDKMLLFPKISEKDYPDFFSECLHRKILISPCFSVPSFLPHWANSGDLKGLLEI